MNLTQMVQGYGGKMVAMTVREDVSMGLVHSAVAYFVVPVALKVQLLEGQGN
jgi:hypothetical protein